MGTNGVLLRVSLFSLSFTSPSHSGSLSSFLVSDASGPEFLFPCFFGVFFIFFKLQGLGENGVRWLAFI